MNSIQSNEVIYSTTPLIVTPCSKIIVKDSFHTLFGRNYKLFIDANGKNLYTQSYSPGKTTTFNLNELNIQKDLQFKIIAYFELYHPCIDNDPTFDNSSFLCSPSCEPYNDFSELGNISRIPSNVYVAKSNFILTYTDDLAPTVSFEIINGFKLIKI